MSEIHWDSMYTRHPLFNSSNRPLPERVEYRIETVRLFKCFAEFQLRWTALSNSDASIFLLQSSYPCSLTSINSTHPTQMVFFVLLYNPPARTCRSATLSTTNPTWPDLGSNRGRRGWKPPTNRLSYDTVIAFSVYLHNWLITLRGVYINRVTILT